MKANLKMATVLTFISMTTVLVGCGKDLSSDATTDTSASGIAASAVGGALSGLSSNGTQARLNTQRPTLFTAMIPKAYAGSSCPTFRSTDSNCSVSGSSMWLNYSGCSFAGYATWTGVQQLSMSSGSAVCGSFPNPGANGTLYRQFVSGVGASTPGSLGLAGALDSATIDDSSANLSNFDNATIASIHNGGYGSAVSFDSAGKRNTLVVGQHITLTGVYDHSVSGSLTLTEGAQQRAVNGQVKIYHNILKVVGTSTFTNVVHTDLCCWPVGGSISTAYSAGANVAPGVLGAKLVGKSETLSFSGTCGSGTLTNADGASTSVSFKRCF